MHSDFLQRTDELIDGLYKLAYNLWWTWNPQAQDIFFTLSERKWRSSNHNAVAVLRSISRNELRARLCERDFAQRVSTVLEEFQRYLDKTDTWWTTHSGEHRNSSVAYFSAEFGLHESLPIYSGGLGILAGDHMKSASDLGVPLFGISLFYRNGYFQQTVAPDGWQYENYPFVDSDGIAVQLVTDQHGSPVIASVEIGHSTVSFHAYKVNVGRTTIFLLDTNRPENELHHREITARVYGGDSTTRIMQEIVLGIGGVRFLRKLDMNPAVYHLNEGHSSFLLLELLRERLTGGASWPEAEQWVRDHAVFTTHTPVPAGHDRFTGDLMEFMLGQYASAMGTTVSELMKIGRENPENSAEQFCMTVLALRLTRAANAVSALHGEVSRDMWKHLYKVDSTSEVPIGHLTNGVHTLGWMAHRTRMFWQKHLGEKWINSLRNTAFWQQVADPDLVPDEDLWALRYGLRRDLIEFLRRVMKSQYQRAGVSFSAVEDQLGSPDVLTIGFARRFATYKRAPLAFRNLQRIIELINDDERPVQFIFAGKAHPRDDEGKKFIQQIVGYTKNPALFGKVMFLENYDINVARHLVSGVDVWLNTPRRPMEASGTSGMKVLIHGGLNFSILDGWWREGYNGTNGWAIGDDSNNADPQAQDEIDAENLYTALVQSIIPEYYDRNELGIPKKWIQRIRNSMVTLIPMFNTDRMVSEYVTRYYFPDRRS